MTLIFEVREATKFGVEGLGSAPGLILVQEAVERTYWFLVENNIDP